MNETEKLSEELHNANSPMVVRFHKMRIHAQKMENPHGGKREGAGRKPGSGTGRTVTTSSINLPPELWAKLDALRDDQTRSAWIAAKIKNARN